MSDRLAKLISTLFSLGYSKYFPGTLGSAAAIPFGLIIIIFLGTNFLIFLIFLLFIISYFAVNIYIRENNVWLLDEKFKNDLFRRIFIEKFKNLAF